MKVSRSPLAPAAVYLGSMVFFLALDLYGLSCAKEWDWTALPAVLGQTLALTVIVGSWICALIFLDSDELAGASRFPRSPAATPRATQERQGSPATAIPAGSRA